MAIFDKISGAIVRSPRSYREYDKKIRLVYNSYEVEYGTVFENCKNVGSRMA